jgi:hypothetical protein
MMLDDKKKAVIMLAIGVLLGAAASVTYAANAERAPKQDAAMESAVASDDHADGETNDGPDGDDGETNDDAPVGAVKQ